MAADVLAILLKTNIAAACGIVLALCLRRPARKVFGARIAYALWLIVPLVVGASLLPARTVTLPYVVAPESFSQIAAPLPSQAIAATVETGPIVDSAALVALWLTGAAVSLGALAWRQARFLKSLGGVVREGRFLRAAASGAGPAVVGAILPRIVLPADFETRYDPAEQKMVLAHEVAHLASGDAVVNALIASGRCLFWFNPLVHIAARVLRVDQELACDAAVLSAYPKMRRAYAEALLKTQVAAAPLPLGCYWPAGASNPLKERIAMLKLETPSAARRFAGATSVLALCLGAAAAAWAAQPASVTVAPRPAAGAASQVGGRVVAKPTPVVTQTARAAASPAPTVATADTSSDRTLVDTTRSTAGNTYERIDADLIPARPYPLSIVMPDGRQKPVIEPRIIPGLLPREETEAYRAAKRVYEAAKEEHAARVAYGRPPQPWTPELQSAIDTLDAFSRDLMAKRVADQEAYYETITVTADEAGSPAVSTAFTVTALPAWPRSTSWKVPRNFTTQAKRTTLAALDARIGDAPPRTRDMLIRIREIVAQKPTTN